MTLPQKSSPEAAIGAALEVVRTLANHPRALTMTELETRSVFIDPLLRAMGFEGPDDVEQEYPVKSAGQRLDYVLLIRGRPAVAVEAKSFVTDLGDKHAAQVVQYAAVEGIGWCVLSNGRSISIYDGQRPGDLAAKHVADFDLLDQSDQEAICVLVLLSKSCLTETPDRMNEWVRARTLSSVLSATLVDPKAGILPLMADFFSRSAGVVVSPDELARWFAARLGPPSPPPPPPPPAGTCWILPAASRPDGSTALDSLRRWLARGFWGLNLRAPCREFLRAGDRAVFYAAPIGVAATAEIVGTATELVTTSEWPYAEPVPPELYRLPLINVRWRNVPLPIDTDVRAKLEAFEGKTSPNWAWFVQTGHRISMHDFEVLSANAGEASSSR